MSQSTRFPDSGSMKLSIKKKRYHSATCHLTQRPDFSSPSQRFGIKSKGIMISHSVPKSVMFTLEFRDEEEKGAIESSECYATRYAVD